MNNFDNESIVKILILGDCQVGKTKFLLEYIKFNNLNNLNFNSDLNNNKNFNLNDSYNLTGPLDDRYVPTSIEVYKSEFKINEKDYILSIADISGNRSDDLYIQMRNYFYLIEKKVDTILLCFSLVDQASYSNITKKWLHEIKKFYPNVPVLLVGTKCDLKQKAKESKLNSAKSDSVKSSLQTSAISDNKFPIDSKKISSELISLTSSIHHQLMKSKSIQDRPISMISKMSREEMFSSTNRIDKRVIDENLKLILEKLSSVPPFLTLNEFVKLNILDDETNGQIDESTELDSSSICNQYVNKKQINKLKEIVNTKYYFKTSCFEINSIRFLMDKAIVTAINFHLKKDRLPFKQSKCNLNNNSHTDRHESNEWVTKTDSIDEASPAVMRAEKSKKNEKKESLCKLRCFSCTRSETSTSLNQI